jgi:hypothetical protein
VSNIRGLIRYMIIILVISTEATNIFTNYQRKGVRGKELEERS